MLSKHPQAPTVPRICGTCAHRLDQPIDAKTINPSWHVGAFAHCAELKKNPDNLLQKTWVALKGTCYFAENEAALGLWQQHPSDTTIAPFCGGAVA
jgi:hypothetical protein